MRTQARRDTTETAIVQALEAIGVVVYRVSSPSIPDLLTWYRGVWLPIEVKRAKGHLTPRQQAAMDWTPYPVVRSVGEALALFGVEARS